MRKVILDLCGGTGSWSQPYVDAGYDVRVVDLPSDVRLMEKPKDRIHGILAAPPCTYFCRMRMCRGVPTKEQFREGLSVVDACIRMVTATSPVWWALENPQGYLHRWLGQPSLKFEPFEYGDAWTKRTWIWGKFTLPFAQNHTKPIGPWVSSRTGHTKARKGLAESSHKSRSKTPPGFARAFFEANP